MMRRVALASAFVCVIVFFSGIAAADGPVYFRHHHGVPADDSHPLPAEIDSKEGYLWRCALPSGHSTPCVSGDRIFLTTYDADEKKLSTVGIDRQSGEILWQRVAPADTIEDFHVVGSPAASSPAADGKRVYSFFGSYGLLCYDREGEPLWKRPLGPFQDEFGASSSPILVDDKVILNEDHDVDSFLIAVNQHDGDIAWKVPRPDFTRSYSTPIVIDVDGKKQLVVAGSLRLTAYEPARGRELWRLHGLSRIVDTTPVWAGGLLYLATWTPGGDVNDRIAMEPFAEALKSYDKNANGLIDKAELPEGNVLARFFRIDLNQDQSLDNAEWDRHARVFRLAQNVAMAIRPDGSGDITETSVKWQVRRGLPVCPSPVVYNGVLYMIKNGGIFTAVDAESGQRRKRGRLPGRGNYYASLAAGDGKIYAASEGGVLSVIRAGNDWDVLSKHDFGERIMATPVIVDGKIYLRTESALYCFGNK